VGQRGKLIAIQFVAIKKAAQPGGFLTCLVWCSSAAQASRAVALAERREVSGAISVTSAYLEAEDALAFAGVADVLGEVEVAAADDTDMAAPAVAGAAEAPVGAVGLPLACAAAEADPTAAPAAAPGFAPAARDGSGAGMG